VSLSYYYELLRMRKEQLQRLQKCESSLSICEQEFHYYKSIITEPALSGATWQGKSATKFDDIRHDEILNSFLDIENRQFTEVFSSLSVKMSQLEQEIRSIQQTISHLEAEEAAERAKK
jgi:hypothetical protein